MQRPETWVADQRAGARLPTNHATVLQREARNASFPKRSQNLLCQPTENDRLMVAEFCVTLLDQIPDVGQRFELRR